MKIRKISDFAEPRLSGMPQKVTSGVRDALLCAHEHVFSRAFWRYKTRPKSPISYPEHILPRLKIKVEGKKEAEKEVKRDPVESLIREKSPSPEDLRENSRDQEDLEPENPTFPTEPQQPVEEPPIQIPDLIPEANAPPPPEFPNLDTYISNRDDSVTYGSQFSQRTTEMTHEIMNFEGVSKKKTKKKRAIKRVPDADLELINKMNEEWEKKQELLARKAKENEDREMMEKQRVEQEAESEKMRLFNERKQRLLARHEAALAAKQLREQQRLEADKAHKRAKSVLPLHRRLENEFKAISENEEIEYKRKLQEIKENMRSVELESILKHKSWYESQREALILQKKLAREQRLLSISKMNEGWNYYKSKALDVLEEEKRALEIEEEEKIEQMKLIHVKQREYAQVVQELYRPSIHADIEPIKKANKRRNQSQRAVSTVVQKMKIVPGLDSKHSMGESHRIIPKIRTSITKSPVRYEEERKKQSPKWKHAFQQKQKKKNTKSNSEMTVVSTSLERGKDYLSEQRLEHEQSIKQQRSMFDYRPSRRLELAGKSCSVQELKEEAEKLGKKAIRKEGLIRHLTGDLNSQIQACSSVSDMYLDSIKAKLRIISSFSGDEPSV